MQRWALILSAYDFDIEYVGTHDNGAEILSRLPVNEFREDKPPVQTYLHFAANELLLDSVAIKKATAHDSVLSRVCEYIENGWPQQVDVKQFEPYFARRKELIE